MSAASLAPAPYANTPLELRSGEAGTPVQRLAQGQAKSFRSSRVLGIRVRHGRAWVTASGSSANQPEDYVVDAGQAVVFGAGESVVIEPWDGRGLGYVIEDVSRGFLAG